jgi:hypothetical protein
MGINNSGITIRSGTKNADAGNLNTQAILPSKANLQLANAKPGNIIPMSVLDTTIKVVANREFIENAKKTPPSPYSLSNNIPASTLNPAVKPLAQAIEKTNREKRRILENLYFRPDVLSLPSNTYTNNRFKNSSLKGIASQRPEIIVLTDFKPIFENQKILKYNNLGYFFDYKFQLLKLREKTIENIKKIFTTNPVIKAEYDRITKNFQDFVKTEEEKLKLIESFVKIFQSIDKAFQIREIDNSFFTTNNLLTIEEFFIRKMNYSKASYNTFSDTKILYQLLFDLRAASENYSINLLNLIDPDRANDVNSVKIDTTYSKVNNFTFDINTLSTRIRGGTPKLSLNEDNFFSFLNSLPSNLSDRIKICLHSFGRILRVSRGLNKPNVKTMLANNFSVSTDFNPFDNVIGIIPNDIFTQPLGNGTIASTFLLSDSANPNIKILPFENTIVDDGETKYVPGNVYFKDDIIETTNTVSLINFGESLVSKISNTSFFYNEIFDFNNLNSNLIPQNIIKIVFETIKNTLNYCTSNTTASAESLIIPALFNLANTDKVLKFYLFQFVLLLGLIRATKESNFELYRKLKIEIKSLRNFPNVEINLDLSNEVDQTSTIKNAAINLANLITTYVSNVLTENSTLQLNTDATFDPPPRNDGFSSLFLQTNTLISRTLLDTVNATNSNKPNLFKDFLDIASIFYNAATPFLNQESEQLTTSTYLNISLSNIMLLLFEAISSISGKFLPIKFNLENGKIFEIIYHSKFLKASQRAIEKLLNGLPKNLYSFQTTIVIPFNQGSPSTNEQYILPISTPFLTSDEEYLRKFDYFYEEYKNLYDSLQGEDSFIQNIISIFDTISFNFNQVKRFAENTFSRLTEEQKQIIVENSGIIQPAQFSISKKLLQKLKQENTLTNILKDNEFYHLSSFVINQNISNDKMKILSVGIPNGFIDNVKERLNKISAINGQEQIIDLKNETNLVSINVYKKSLLNEEIIFKPQKFLFDLTLDVAPYDNAASFDPTDSFENNNKLLKFIQNDDLLLTPKTKQQILTNDKYKNLSLKVKEEIITNTIKSYLISKYCYLSTGLEIIEEAFPLTDYNFVPSDEFNAFLRLYLLSQNIQITSFDEILKNDIIDQNIKDNVILIKKVFNEFNNQTIDSIIFTPKSFDKIFNIVVNIQDFEIDTELTNSTTLENEQIRERLYKKDNKLFIKSFNSADMDEFYIAVEILG